MRGKIAVYLSPANANRYHGSEVPPMKALGLPLALLLASFMTSCCVDIVDYDDALFIAFCARTAVHMLALYQ
ncbi:MAG: hypothetical protein R3178_07645, partial [Rhodothermales bacterium]|nr:hypothetical protein [Rhodothermales bacterium]